MLLERMNRLAHRVLTSIVMALIVMAVLPSCSSTKHVPQGQLLLDKVNIHINDPQGEVEKNQLANYLRQNANHRVLGGLKLQLAFYNLSGRDSTKWINRWIQRVGTPPVIYDSTLTVASAEQLHTALSNQGYMKNTVTYQVKADSAKRKARVDYDITLGEPYYIRSISYDIPDVDLHDIILADSAHFTVHRGDLLNYTKLDEWRQSITENLRNQGYYAFNKEYITFLADTAADSHAVDLTLNSRDPYHNDHMPYYTEHEPFYVRDVVYVTDFDPVSMQDGYWGVDTVTMPDGVRVLEGEEKYLRLDLIDECNHIEPGSLYNAEAITRTYRALGRLSILKQINIDVRPVGKIDGVLMVDAFVLLQRDHSQAVSVSLEGTNSEGDLGFGVGLDYQHRNIFKGAEVFNAKARVSYESISGKLGGLINNNYSEYSTELGITFPKFMAPFLKRSFKRKIQASTAFTVNFDYQARPEYTRVIAGGGWRYQWTERSRRMSHTFTLFDLSVINLPKFDKQFLDSITNDSINPMLSYSYKNHVIMRMGYNFYRTNKAVMNVQQMGRFQRDVFTIRAAIETAGNLLYGLSHLTRQKPDDDGAYRALGIRYSQYVKADADYSLTHYFDRRQSIAFHVGAGIAIPYGNSDVLPFEKRFYSGGANSVRGWGVRTLGPGSYNSNKQMSNFIFQCGDIRFDINLEYRAKLFWVVELGLFLDAGNIWTIKDYDHQPGGVFKFNKFYEQIAMAYGAGIRLDFKYFLVRVDMGMKAHNPASGQEKWPLTHPNFKRDSEFHFTVGYPF
ncbi:MAG: BamA/TamA family outer membrane protein [Muribaculaceae bacterium]|nr:BamA/TamA family outer membrane protein [Muribaculaceae bacterium]